MQGASFPVSGLHKEAALQLLGVVGFLSVCGGGVGVLCVGGVGVGGGVCVCGEGYLC